MKTIYITAIAILSTTGLFAQRSATSDRQRVHQEITVQDRVENMNKSLNLTEKQKADLTNFFTKTDAERKKTVEEAKITRETRRVEAEKRRTANEAELKQILGEEKFNQWRESNSGNRNVSSLNRRNSERGFNRSGSISRNAESGNRGTQRGSRVILTPQEQAEKLAKDLDLTDSQKASLTEHFTEMQAAREKNRNNTELSRGDRRAQAEIRIKENNAKLKEILGETKFKELQERRAVVRNRSTRR